MHDALMGYNGATDEAALSRIAEGLGLDAEAIVAKLDDPAVADEIAETRRLANILKVSGTPTFVFQDQMVRGYVPLNAMEQIVEDQRGG